MWLILSVGVGALFGFVLFIFAKYAGNIRLEDDIIFSAATVAIICIMVLLTYLFTKTMMALLIFCTMAVISCLLVMKVYK